MDAYIARTSFAYVCTSAKLPYLEVINVIYMEWQIQNASRQGHGHMMVDHSVQN